MRFWLVVWLASCSSTFASEWGILGSSATGRDLLNTCSAVYVNTIKHHHTRQSKSDSIHISDTLLRQQQCYAFLSGIAHGNTAHTVMMNGILHRKPTDTMYSAICVDNVPYFKLADSVVTYIMSHPKNSRVLTMPSGLVAFAALSDSYPCPMSNPM